MLTKNVDKNFMPRRKWKKSDFMCEFMPWICVRLWWIRLKRVFLLWSCCDDNCCLHIGKWALSTHSTQLHIYELMTSSDIGIDKIKSKICDIFGAKRKSKTNRIVSNWIFAHISARNCLVYHWPGRLKIHERIFISRFEEIQFWPEKNVWK